MGHLIAVYHSYTFCPLEFLEIIHNIDSNTITAKTILFKFILTSNKKSPDESTFNSILDSFKKIISWLVNIMHLKVEPSPSIIRFLKRLKIGMKRFALLLLVLTSLPPPRENPWQYLLMTQMTMISHLI